MRLNNQEFLAKPLRAHTFLADVPLHDVWGVDLPGGGDGRTLQDLQSLLSFIDLERVNLIVAGLFKLRWQLGRWFGWDEREEVGPCAASYLH